MPKNTKKKKAKVADFSVMSSSRDAVYRLILGSIESEAEAWKREEAADQCRGHDVQSEMFVDRSVTGPTCTFALTLAHSYCASDSKYYR